MGTIWIRIAHLTLHATMFQRDVGMSHLALAGGLAAFEEDFRVSFADGRLMRAIEQAEKKAVARSIRGATDYDESPEPTEKAEVKQALQTYTRQIYTIFRYFSGVGAASDPANATSLSKLGYSRLLDALCIEQKNSLYCSRGHLDTIFKTVDAAHQLGGEEAEADTYNERNSLNRQEFLRVLVRVAIARYVAAGEVTRVTTAVHSLFEEYIVPNMGPPDAFGPGHNSNEFRRNHCYTPAVTHELERNEALLRRIYSHFASLEEVDETELALATSKLMSLGQWLAACEPIVRIMTTFTFVEAAYCGQFARMLVIDESTKKGVVKPPAAQRCAP
eukprot:5978904-Prymnesium_polylepis.1